MPFSEILHLHVPEQAKFVMLHIQMPMPQKQKTFSTERICLHSATVCISTVTNAESATASYKLDTSCYLVILTHHRLT